MLLRPVLLIVILLLPASVYSQEMEESDDGESWIPRRATMRALISALENEGADAMDTTAAHRLLIRDPALVDSVDEEGLTLLHHVVQQGAWPEAATFLIRRGAAVDARDRQGRTALFSADTREFVRVLIDHGADVNARDSVMRTPIFAAEDAQVIDLLLAHGADINAVDRRGTSPLHFRVTALAGGSTVETLIARGASVGLRGSAGNTPLHAAVQYGDSAVVALLVRAGADVNASNELGHTPLHLAAYSCRRPEAVRALLAGRPNLEAVNRANRTPLVVAVEQQNGVVARILLEAGALIPSGAPAREEDDWQAAPLLVAAGNGDTATLRALLDHGAPATFLGRSGETPLHLAGNGQTARILLERGARRDARDSIGSRRLQQEGITLRGSMTPIECAVGDGREGVAVRLLEAGADPGPSLRIAAQLLDPFWTALLLRYGAKPDEMVFRIARERENDAVLALLNEWVRSHPVSRGRR